MMRALALIAAILAVSIGVWFRPVPADRAASTPGGEPTAWGDANGFRLERSEPLTASGIYLIHHYAGAGGCHLSVIPLGSADEIMPRLQGLTPDHGASEHFLLLNALGSMPETAIGVNIRRLLARVRDGHVAQPVMVVAGPTCHLDTATTPLTAWPAP